MDVHQKEIVVCVITGPEGEEPQIETRSFPTMTRDLYDLLRWLESKEVTHIAMESTGIYWKPVYNIFGGLLRDHPGQRPADQKCPRSKDRCLRCGMDRTPFTPRAHQTSLRSTSGYPGTSRADPAAEKMGRSSHSGEKPNSKGSGVLQHQVGNRDFRYFWCLRPQLTGTLSGTRVCRCQ
ncbi:hypothetical protein C8P63_10446 [Melghirimyces profundicolus]|uniref:Transposase IS110-like N-terminal domain-containing protein n=1 Tax=Melghirimyces profundicolus TaxID=1242148 RepID=A0A2T6C4I5_9BACL|nr:hypothetical protein C8P63_10446 [Melghirimyces profundicolus]